MLITNAPWMKNLPCHRMTPQRRVVLEGGFEVIQSYICSNHVILYVSPSREQLYKLQRLKSIRMVKKYRDSRGTMKVVAGLQSVFFTPCYLDSILHCKTPIDISSHISYSKAGSTDLTKSQVYPMQFAYKVTQPN